VPAQLRDASAAAAAHTCRTCREPLPEGRPFCYECGTRPAPGALRKSVLVIEAASGVAPSPLAAPLLARLMPSLSREAAAALLEHTPALLFVEIEESRIPALVRRLEREGLRVRVQAGISPWSFAQAFMGVIGRRTALLAEVSVLGAATGTGFMYEPLAGLGALALTGARLFSHARSFIRSHTLSAPRIEALQHPLASERGERLRQSIAALKEPALRDPVRRALVGYEQAVAAAEGDSPLIAHLWLPVAPLLLKYLEQIVTLAGRADRLERYLRELPTVAAERDALLTTLSLEGDEDEQARAAASLTAHQRRREDLQGAARLIRARIDRAVLGMQSLRGSLLELSILGDGQGTSLNALARVLEDEIEAMALTLREVEGLRSDGPPARARVSRDAREGGRVREGLPEGEGDASGGVSEGHGGGGVSERHGGAEQGPSSRGGIEAGRQTSRRRL
jgi:hypothetical protein